MPRSLTSTLENKRISLSIRALLTEDDAQESVEE